MRYLSLAETLELHRLVIEESGCAERIRDLNGLQSALAQPRQTFGGQDLYPTLAAKGAALCFSLLQNHPFLDGNKRVGHAAMESFLVLNGKEIRASVDEQEKIIMLTASGKMTLAQLTEWLDHHVVDTE